MRLQKNDILSFLPKGLVFVMGHGFKTLLNSIKWASILSFASIYAQTNQPINQYLYKIANEKFKQGDYYDAIPDFETLVKENPDNADVQFKYGACIAESGKDKIKALPFLKTVYKSGNYKASFYLGKVYYSYMQFDSAHYYLTEFVKKGEPKESRKTEAVKMLDHLFDALLLLNQQNGITIENAGENINSSAADYSPVISADNSQLYFTSKREESYGQRKDENGQYFEDIYLSKTEDSLFQKAENVGTPLNSKEHDATVALSADGSLMILYRTDPYSGSGDLFFSRKEGLEWDAPVKLGLNINSLHNETSASLSADGSTLYFTSNRPGGLGGLDLYKSTRGKNGVWGIAKNLGAPINTSLDEESPHISVDGKVLYFSSKGHEPNMGGFDVFRSEMDRNGTWTKPSNLGFPVNTLQDDLYFVQTANAQTGYISSNRIDSQGDLDIYNLKLNGERPNITLLKGVVKESRTNNPIKAGIEVIDRTTAKALAKYYSNSANGSFLIIIRNDLDLKIVFEKGSSSFTEIFDAAVEKGYREIYKVIELEDK